MRDKKFMKLEMDEFVVEYFNNQIFFSKKKR